MMVLVSSSRNSGTPSVRARICSRISAGSALPPADRSTRVMPSRRPRRASGSVVTWASAGQGGVNSGRAVTRSSNGSVDARATVRVNSSSEVGSIQCASSNSISTGCRAASRAICASSASSVFSLRRCGVRSGRRYLSPVGIDIRSAMNPISSAPAFDRASKASSLASRASAMSSRLKPAACSSWVMKGWSALA